MLVRGSGFVPYRGKLEINKELPQIQFWTIIGGFAGP